MILIINICKEKLHYYEFVKPIEDILKSSEERKNKEKCFTKHYLKLRKKDLKKADKIIICGTSLKDSKYLNEIESFKFLKKIKKPILGICAGMQIIGLIFGSKLKRKTEIGFYEESFKKEFFRILGKQKVYHLHNYYIETPKNFIEFTNSKIPQTIKYKTRQVYGVLFHPEVRQKDLIRNFIKIK